MREDCPSLDQVLGAVGARVDPKALMSDLQRSYGHIAVTEGLQRAIERGLIIFDNDGFVIPTPPGTWMAS